MAAVYAVIMAGGRGERFWPLSTEACPKPFVPLLGSRSLIEETVDRLLPLVPIERILVSIGRPHLKIAIERLPQIPRANFIVEPMGRDTSACLGFCALHLERLDADAIMLVLPADHYVADPGAFCVTIRKGIQSLEGAEGVIFGIVPIRPDPGYGYVHAEKPSIRTDAWPVLRFVEKPDIEMAADYIHSGSYFWNSGMFLWRNQTLLELFRKHMPETYHGLSALRPLLGRDDTQDEVARIFSGLQRMSIDFGILEKASGLRLVPAEFVWDDIGNWAALARALPGDALGNLTIGHGVSVDSSGCLIYSDNCLVATLGVSDLVIVHVHGKLLVCPKDRAAELKRLVSLLPPQTV
ncbi:MAG TPA: sugar phosphate nucleotidyltransferase [Acidobacteriota bacterium]|nr:sugar phosphate nucleotidyltransferase [Acidobacteriota bacterium]